MSDTYLKDYTNTFDIKGHSYTVTAPARFDVVTGELVDDRVLDDQAVEIANDMYRHEFHIVSPVDIKAFRHRLMLSQRDFAKLIGVSPNTIALYEAGAFPTTAHNRLLKLLMNDDNSLQSFIKADKNNIPLPIRHKITDVLYPNKQMNSANDDSNNKLTGVTGYSSVQLANWFRVKNHFDSLIDKNVEELSQMKVVKLLYFAFGRYAQRTNQKLFNSSIIAMPYGPVVEEVHQCFKGRTGIVGNKLEDSAYDDYALIASDFEINELLSEIDTDYGDKTAVELSRITHREGSPWSVTERGRSIDERLILKTFKRGVEQ